MTLTRQLSREDMMFVAGETESLYQHVGLLTILDPTGRPEFDFEHFRQQCIERVSLIPYFRWKLHAVPMGLDRPCWVEDEHFSFDHHIKRVALPQPGDQETLCDVAANLIVYNVRGMPVPMCIAGARIENMYPMSVITAGLGINFTCISYQDSMDFGIIVDPDQVPDHHSITDGLKTALEEYLVACRPGGKTAKRTTSKAKSKTAPRSARGKKRSE